MHAARAGWRSTLTASAIAKTIARTITKTIAKTIARTINQTINQTKGAQGPLFHAGQATVAGCPHITPSTLDFGAEQRRLLGHGSCHGVHKHGGQADVGGVLSLAVLHHAQ
jgi:hypothetical protein